MFWRTISISLVVLALLGFAGCKGRNTVPPPPATAMDAYNSIQEGMTYQEVVSRMGKAGTKAPELDLKTYSWGKSEVIFRKNAVASVTGNLFVKGVKVGMTYPQVVAKAGAEGKLTLTQICYTWQVGNRPRNIFFTNDKVTRKDF